MGFFTSSSKNTSQPGQAGSQTQQGDPVALNLQASDDSRSIANVSSVVELTDYGAIEAALNFSDQLANREFQLSQQGIESAERLSTKLIDKGENFGRYAIGKGESVGSTLANKGENFGRYAIDKGENIGSKVLTVAADTLDTARVFSSQLLKQTSNQGQQFTGALQGLTSSFQSFVNRENNPGERVNLYFVGAISLVAIAFILRGKKSGG